MGAALTTDILKFIGGHEGFVSKLYRDPVGIWTIGYGFTWASEAFRKWWLEKHGRKFQPGDTISQSDATAVLRLVLADEYAPPVEKKLGAALVHTRKAAYSMVFNSGPGSLDWNWANLIAAGDIEAGCARWRTTAITAKGKKLPGLVRRRKEEADIAEHNLWPAWLKNEAPGKTIPLRHIIEGDIKLAQEWLTQLGYSPGPADGIVGSRTRAAVIKFQDDANTLVVDGIIGKATLAALQRRVNNLPI